jgi:hypothetical protein
MARTRMAIDHVVGKRYVGRNEGDRIFIDGEDISAGVRPMEALLAALGKIEAVLE